MNPEDEAIQTVKIVEFIKYKYKQVSGTNRDDYIDREIRGKKRFCRECFEKLKKDEEEREEERRRWDDFNARYFDDLHKEEMERMNKPIESCTTDLDLVVAATTTTQERAPVLTAAVMWLSVV